MRTQGLSRLAFAAALILPFMAANGQPASPRSGEQAASCLPQGPFPGPAAYKSIEQLPDGRLTFRLCAPDARRVLVTSPDIPQIPSGFGGPVTGLVMTRDKTGLWTATTTAPVAADTYRYDFNVEGVNVPDPQATRFVGERLGVDSLAEVTGPEGTFQTWRKEVPHGVVSEITYWSSTLGMPRRAFVYTPPGYMKEPARYPVLYLVHGAGDSDASWTRTGHANLILDNLIAAGKAKPMIVVMPFGHTPDRPGSEVLTNADFGNDLIRDLIPFADANLRTIATADSRAMAGLSMGGAHSLRFGITHPELFHWIGIFSMGLGAALPPAQQQITEQVSAYEVQNGPALREAARSVRLVDYAVGREDFLYSTAAPTRAMLARYGIRPVYNESGGGHTWINWRRYLADFAPRLFR